MTKLIQKCVADILWERIEFNHLFSQPIGSRIKNKNKCGSNNAVAEKWEDVKCQWVSLMTPLDWKTFKCGHFVATASGYVPSRGSIDRWGCIRQSWKLRDPSLQKILATNGSLEKRRWHPCADAHNQLNIVCEEETGLSNWSIVICRACKWTSECSEHPSSFSSRRMLSWSPRETIFSI